MLLKDGVQPAGSKSIFHRNSTTHSSVIKTIGHGEENVVVDIATPVIPDARLRIKQR